MSALETAIEAVLEEVVSSIVYNAGTKTYSYSAGQGVAPANNLQVLHHIDDTEPTPNRIAVVAQDDGQAWELKFGGRYGRNIQAFAQLKLHSRDNSADGAKAIEASLETLFNDAAFEALASLLTTLKPFAMFTIREMSPSPLTFDKNAWVKQFNFNLVAILATL